MLEASYEAWAYDTRSGLHSLLIAASNDDVAALNARARLERIHTGEVEPDGVDLRDSNRAGVGDRVVTRTNRRDLTICGGRDFVKNGDSWSVDCRHTNGDLTVRNAEHQAAVRLPADYVAEAVELYYATTTARAQGTTVDTTHILVDDSTTREALYVAATRGRNGAHIYVATDDLLDISAERPPAPTPPDRIVLEDALQREAGERSATEVQRDNNTATLPALIARYEYAIRTALRERHQTTVRDALPRGMAEEVLDDTGYTSLAVALAQTEKQGKNPVSTLTEAAAMPELDTADSIADVLRHRIELKLLAPDAETDAPWLGLTDPNLVSNCGSAWHSYVNSCEQAISASVTERCMQLDDDLTTDQLLLVAYRERTARRPQWSPGNSLSHLRQSSVRRPHPAPTRSIAPR